MTYLLDSGPDPRPDAIRLPLAPSPRRRGGMPIAAALVPIVGAVGMWAVTGSVFALWFAALGPLMAVAALLDGVRGTRRDQRAHRRELAVAVAAASATIAAQHALERDARWQTHPDVARLAADRSSIWRAHPARVGTLTLGSGRVATDWRILSGDEREEAARLRATAAVVTGAPVVVSWHEGVYVRGQETLARAVARAMVLQICLTHAPGSVRVVVEDAREQAWAAGLPHAADDASGERLALTGPGADTDGVDAVIAWGDAETIPPACGVVVDAREDLHGGVERAGRRVDLAVEAVSIRQAQAVVAELGGRVGSAAAADEPVVFGDIRETTVPGALGAVLGVESGRVVGVDLVADGPHAVVVGTTGSGKSELLCTWALALADAHPPNAVALLLVDFKGGMAFDTLRGLPHVTGVLTDLDGGGARRAVESLRAEIRRREAAIAAAHARDVGDPGTGLARLVIVVDEFGALLQQHPDLDAVFGDVAARGRALGMHLILGSQRAQGAFRDHILANCAVRVALRVADTTDSRTVIGGDEAARLPGDTRGRGLALIRRAGDPVARRTRIALTRPADRAAVAARWRAAPAPAAPWLPPLPAVIEQADLPCAPGAIPLGLVDDPERQRQECAVLRPGVDRGLCVIGGVGSGTSSIARLVAGAVPGTVVLDAEHPADAWDALERALDEPPRLLVCDDADRLIAAWGDLWGRDGAERIDEIVRTRRETTVVLTAHRLSGPLLRTADLLPCRAVLRTGSRAEHLAAGGVGDTWDQTAPPGRGRLDGRLIQFAWAEAADTPVAGTTARWRPGLGPTALIVRGARRRAERLAGAWGVAVTPVEDLDPVHALPGAPLPPALLIGDGEAWQRSWQLLARLRSDGDIVVGTECMTELRTMVGERSLPPYAEAGQAWLVRAGGAPVRVTLD